MFFDVIAKARTWRNVGYLLLAFPLGIFYFVFLVTGLSLGAGLFITLLGIPILVGVLAAAYGLGAFERTLTNGLLGQHTPPAGRLAVEGTLWDKVKALFGSAETWKRVAYLFLVFPLGIIGFSLVVTTFALFALVATPLFYLQDWWITSGDWPTSWWAVDSTGDAFLVAGLGILAGFVLLHVCNFVAKAWGEFARLMLGPTRHHPAPVEPRPLEKTAA
jgi:hypothetical protein